MDNKIKLYEAPKIEDHGDLAELTAGKSHGKFLDSAFPAGAPFEELTFTAVAPPTP